MRSMAYLFEGIISYRDQFVTVDQYALPGFLGRYIVTYAAHYGVKEAGKRFVTDALYPWKRACPGIESRCHAVAENGTRVVSHSYHEGEFLRLLNVAGWQAAAQFSIDVDMIHHDEYQRARPIKEINDLRATHQFWYQIDPDDNVVRQYQQKRLMDAEGVIRYEGWKWVGSIDLDKPDVGIVEFCSAMLPVEGAPDAV